MTETIQIKNFISNEWAQYADYDNRRSLPHIIDGLKITQRKALFTATKLPKNDKPIRVSQFSAKAAELTAYHHGDTSMIETVIKLAQNFPGSNNYPLLEKHGQFGTKLSKDASAPRYIHTKLHDNWSIFFKNEDQEIVEHLYDDGDEIEPKYFIPIVPMILVNGAEGMGNGFRTDILSYSVKSLIKACKEIIKTGNVKTPLIPYINGWTGTIEKNEKQIILTGSFQIISNNKIQIDELPPSYDNEKYKKLLNKLLDNNIIKDYENKSTEDKWKWIIHVPKAITQLDKTKLLEMFGLVEKTTETFVCWGIDSDSPLTFDSPESLVEHWYHERIKLYQKSINNQIKKCKEKIIESDIRLKFINWCLNNDFRKLSKNEFIENILKIKGMTEDHANRFINTPMYKITTDEVKKLNNDIDKLLDNLDNLEKLTPIDIMENDFKELNSIF